MPAGLKSYAKFFAGDTSLSQLLKKEKSASDLTNDLDTISTWAYIWKMSFNLDLKKPAQGVLFSRKNSNITHQFIYFNNVQVQRADQRNI